MAVFALGLGATVLLNPFAPKSFLPDEDNGYFFVTAQLPKDACAARGLGRLRGQWPGLRRQRR
jgi:multidrug efflux pump subunit AcrB